MENSNLVNLIERIAQLQLELQNQLAKTDAQLAKTDAQLAKTDRKLKELSEMYGGMSNNQGKVAEEFFYNSLRHNPELDGIQFDFVMKNVTRGTRKIQQEYDLILVSEKFVYVLEVKYKLNRNDIERFIGKKLPNFRILFPEYRNRELRFGFASFSMEDELIDLANAEGFLLLQRRGKVFKTLAA